MTDPNGRSAESGAWSIDIDTHSVEGDWHVMLSKDALLLEFSCPGAATLARAAAWLRGHPETEPLPLGSFSQDVSVELTCFEEPENNLLYLCLSGPEGGVLSLRLDPADIEALASLFATVGA